MLAKLLKYDLKAIFKFLAIFYGLALIFAIITRMLFAVNDSLLTQIFAQIFNGATISMIANILINNLMRLWVYFKTNLYGDEGYLMHTLPVPRRDLYAAKFLAGLITLSVSTIIIAVVMAIAYLTPESFEGLKNFLLPITDAMDSTMIKFMVAIVGLVFLEVLSILVSGYLGIILGNKRLNERTRWSVGLGLVIYGVISVVVVIGVLIMAAINPEIGNSLLTGGEMPNISVLKPICILAMIIYTVMIGVCYLVSEKCFSKINIE